VADAAAALSVIQSRTSDGRDPATAGVPLGWQGTGRTRPNIPTDYTKFIDPNGLKGARIGVTRAGLDGFGPPGFPTFVATPATVLAAIEAAFAALTAAGATVVDLDNAGFTFPPADGETLVLVYDFKFDVAKYFATRTGVPVAGGTLQTAIDFNNAHAAAEMPFFSQDIFDLAQSMNPDPDFVDPRFSSLPFDNNFPDGLSYNQALKNGHDVGANGIDLALSKFKLDAVVSATDNPAWANDFIYGDHFLFGTSTLAAPPGYPIVQVPAGNVFGVPLGISFFGTAFSEGKLIKLASGYEAATQARAKNLPQLLQSIPDSPVPEAPLVTPGPAQDGSRRATVRRSTTHEHHHM
jgi:amidase